MDLMKYINQARDAYVSGYNQIQDAKFTRAEELEKWKNGSPDLKESVANAQHNDIIRKFDDAVREARFDTAAKIGEIKFNYEQEVKDAFRPSGSAIDADDSAILNSGINLTDSEIVDMVMRYSENYTMIRLIASYLDRAHRKIDALNSTDVQRLIVRVTSGGAAYFAAWRHFDGLCRNIAMSTEDIKGVIPLMDSYVDMAHADILEATPYLTDEIRAEIDKYNQDAEQKRRDVFGLGEGKSTGHGVISSIQW